MYSRYTLLCIYVMYTSIYLLNNILQLMRKEDATYLEEYILQTVIRENKIHDTTISRVDRDWTLILLDI